MEVLCHYVCIVAITMFSVAAIYGALFNRIIKNAIKESDYHEDVEEEDTAVIPKHVIDLYRIQCEQNTWRKRNFPNSPDWNPLVGINEEIGEAATAFLRIVESAGRIDHAYLKQSQGIRISEDHMAKIVDAIGDMLIFTIDFCNRLDIDLTDCIRQTWLEVQSRDWQRNKMDGKY